MVYPRPYAVPPDVAYAADAIERKTDRLLMASAGYYANVIVHNTTEPVAQEVYRRYSRAGWMIKLGADDKRKNVKQSWYFTFVGNVAGKRPSPE